MRSWSLVATVVMALVVGACGGDPLVFGPDADASPGAAGADGAAAGPDAQGMPAIEGCWVAEATGSSLELRPDGGFTLAQANGESSRGTWSSDGRTYLTFYFPSGVEQAMWTAALTASTLTLTSGAGATTWTFVRSPAAACAN